MPDGLLTTIEERTQLAGHNRLAMLLFRLGGDPLFGVNVFKVQEVVQRPELQWMPGAHPLVLGVANVRGRSFPVLDLAAAVRQPSTSEPQYLAVTEFNRTAQGFLVHSVDRIINVSVEDITPPPRVTHDDSFLTAVTRHRGQLVQIIDVEKVLAEVMGAPAEVDESLVERAQFSQGFGGRRALVVDDSSVARGQIQRTLAQLGIECTLVNDGREALRHLQGIHEQGGDVTRKYAMVISDIEMPDMDGYTLTTAIRRDPNLSGLYVMLHTSLSGVFNKKMVDQVGADRFVAKYAPDDLATAVLERFERAAA